MQDSKHGETAALLFKILNDDKVDLAKKIVLDEVEKLAMFDCDNNKSWCCIYDGEITEEMADYSFRAIYSFITIRKLKNLEILLAVNFINLKKEGNYRIHCSYWTAFR